MMKNIFRTLPLLLILLATACSQRSAAPDDAALSAGIDSLFTSMFAPDTPGAVVLVAHGDSVVYSRGFGLARLDTVAPLTDTTMVNICSISKQFAALAILKLAEEGRLSLDDTVDKFFPEYKAPFFKRITLRHLLSHTSGLPDARPRTDQEWACYLRNHESRFDSVADFRRLCLEDESLEFFTTLDSLAFEPGTAYEYQNPTYQLVLPIVEQVTGEDFDSWMHRNIFAPAGMKATLYFEPGKHFAPMAHGYEQAPDGQWRESDFGEANFFGTKADGALYTTARDFLAYERALFGGSLAGDSIPALMATPIILTDIPDTRYGLGLFIEDRPGRPRKIYHTGDNGGFYTFEGFFPDRDVFYLIFANRPDWNRDETVEKVDSILRTTRWI